MKNKEQKAKTANRGNAPIGHMLSFSFHLQLITNWTFMNFNINPKRTATSNEKEKTSNNNYDIVSLCDTLSTLKTNEKQCHAKEKQR